MIRPNIALSRRGKTRETPVSRITRWETTGRLAAIERSFYPGPREATYRPVYRVLDLSGPTAKIVSRHRLKRRAVEAALRLAIELSRADGDLVR